ncbi:MAG: bacteriohemerythrin [Sulfuricella denitrificans]|nr:bacteriohemerythrin [Sulfuricella denitrificans]
MENKVFFAWNDAMSVGIAEIDVQHKTLVGILNRLCMAVAQFESSGITVEILDALVDYTRIHFALEEKLLKDAGHDVAEFDAHLLEHRAFIARIGNIASMHRAEGKSVSLEILSLLKRWLQEHILIADKKYASSLKEAGFSTKEWSEFAKNVMSEKQEAAPKRKQWWKAWQAQQNSWTEN